VPKLLQGLTRAQILKKIPNLKPGSFDNYRLRAGIAILEKRPNKRNPNLMEFLYSHDSVERIKAAMPNGGEKQ
jgi:hypothetical protein